MGVLDDDRERVLHNGLPAFQADAFHDFAFQKKFGTWNTELGIAENDDTMYEVLNRNYRDACVQISSIIEPRERGGRFFVQGFLRELQGFLNTPDPLCLERRLRREMVRSILTLIDKKYMEDLSLNLSKKSRDLLSTEALEHGTALLMKYRNEKADDLVHWYVRQRIRRLLKETQNLSLPEWEGDSLS